MMQLATNTLIEAAGAEPVVRIIRDLQEWQCLRSQWDELFYASPTRSAPLRFDWLQTWWRVYGPAYADPQDLRILTVRRSDKLIGALPLYRPRRGRTGLAVRRLRFLSTGEAEIEEICPDYMDLLHLPGQEQTCLKALADVLFQGPEADWDQIELGDLSGRSPLLAWRQAAPGFRAKVIPRGACPIADISGGLEAYLSRLSANSRQQARRLLRSADRAGAQLEVAWDESAVTRIFEDLIRLHQERWTAAGQPGCFAAPRFTDFHRTLARLWVPTGKALLARLVLQGTTQAVIYGFIVNQKFDFYQSGITTHEQPALKSPGIVAFLKLMAHLASRGITHFDFLRGPSGYKQRLATEECPMVQLRLVRPTLRTGLHAAASMTRRALRKGSRLLRQSNGSATRSLLIECL